MIKTSCGLMTPMEAKIIGDIDRDLKNAVTLPIKKKEQKWEGHPFNQGPQQIIVLADVKQLF